MGIISSLLGRCKFQKNCTLYSKMSHACNKSEGNAYGTGFEFRPGGCYRSLEENGNKSKFWKEKIKEA